MLVATGSLWAEVSRNDGHGTRISSASANSSIFSHARMRVSLYPLLPAAFQTALTANLRILGKFARPRRFLLRRDHGAMRLSEGLSFAKPLQ
jgi:hypothetical protein